MNPATIPTTGRGAPAWTQPPDREVIAPDGRVEVWLPVPGQWPGRAVTRPDTGQAAEVIWQRFRSEASVYLCAVHGIGHRYDHCTHTRAAVLAAGLITTNGR